MIKILLIILAFLITSTISQVFAHPGGRDSNGGHYCRKTGGCQDGDKFYQYNEYHCHTATCTLPSETQNPSSTPNPTPASTASPSQQTGNNFDVQLSEIYPAPNSGEKEWVEVYNPNSQSLDLSNWKFQDAAGNKRSLNGIVAGNSFAFFEYSSGWLNNGGDTVSLLDANGSSVDSHSYSEIGKGLAWAKDSNSSWQQTSTPTPGAANQITAPAESQSGSSKSSASKKSTTPTTLPAAGTTQQILGKKIVGSKSFSGQAIEQNFASPSFNLATQSGESSPEVQVAASQKSNLGPILLALGGLIILGSAIFGFVKKTGWKWKL